LYRSCLRLHGGKGNQLKPKRSLALTFSHRLQSNLAFRLGVGKVTPAAIEKYSKMINFCRRNENNMKQHVDGEWINKEVLPDLSPDIEAIAAYLTRKLGATKAAVTKATERNEMSGGNLKKEDCAFSQIMMAKGNLQQWLSKVVENGDLYKRENIVPQGEPNPEVQNADVGEENEEEEANGGIGVEDEDGEEEEPLSMEEETSDGALLRARAYLKKHKVKPLRGEDNEGYVKRIADIMFDGKNARKTRSERMRSNAAKPKEKTDAEHAIAVAAQEEWNRVKNLRPKKPTRILEKRQGAEVGRFYLCLYHDVGFNGQDREELHPEHYVRQFPGFLENWQAVSVVRTIESQ